MKIITVEWWMYSGRQDDYDNHWEDVQATNTEEAIHIIKTKYPRAKHFKTSC